MNNITLLQTQIVDITALECKSNISDVKLTDKGKDNSIFNEILNNLLTENNIDNENKNIDQDLTMKNPTSNKFPVPNLNSQKFGQNSEPIFTIKTMIDDFVDDKSKVNQAYTTETLTPEMNENLVKFEKNELKIIPITTKNSKPENVDKLIKDTEFTEKEITITPVLIKDKPKESQGEDINQIKGRTSKQIDNIQVEKIEHQDNQYIKDINQPLEILGYVDIYPAVISNNETVFQNEEIKTIEITQDLYDRTKELLSSNNVKQTELETITIVDDNPKNAIDNSDVKFTERDINPTSVLMEDKLKEIQSEDVDQIMERPSKQTDNIQVEKINQQDSQYVNEINQPSRTLGYIDIQQPVITDNEIMFQNNEIKTIEITQDLYDRTKELSVSDNVEQVKPEAIKIVGDNSKPKIIDRPDIAFTGKEGTQISALVEDKPVENQNENTNVEKATDKSVNQIANKNDNELFINPIKIEQVNQNVSKEANSKKVTLNQNSEIVVDIQNLKENLNSQIEILAKKIFLNKNISEFNLKQDNVGLPNLTNSSIFKDLNISKVIYDKPKNTEPGQIKIDNLSAGLSVDQTSTESKEIKQVVKPKSNGENFQMVKPLSYQDFRQERTIFDTKATQKIEDEIQDTTIKHLDNKENVEVNSKTFVEKIDVPIQKIVNENVFAVQKTENTIVYEDAEINSKILELPEKIVEYVKVMKSNNDMKIHSVIIHLDPPNLGKIKLKVLMEANKVKAEMNITNSITKEIIEAQLPEIRRSLMQYDINLSEFNVMLDNNSSKNNSQNLLQQEKWSTQTLLYDRNNENKGNEEQKRHYMRFISNNSLVDLLT